MMGDYDNADLGIVALLLLGVAALGTGYVEQGMLAVIVAAIAGIARPNSNGTK
jgi:hypothetical protein